MQTQYQNASKRLKMARILGVITLMASLFAFNPSGTSDRKFDKQLVGPPAFGLRTEFRVCITNRGGAPSIELPIGLPGQAVLDLFSK
ncbi:MAG: hypothetical protein ABI651_04690 [Verrucomicrobiota bacterium]